MTDKEIVELLKDQNKDGLTDLLTYYGPLMRYIIAPILSDTRDREECLSECAMRVWEKIDSFDMERGSWTAWLTAVTRNTALNHLRTIRHHGEQVELDEKMPSPEPGPEEAILRKERSEALQKVIQYLTEREQVLIYRKYYYMQSTAQMAAEMGMTERAVEGKIYRIKQKLRKQLGGELHG